MPVTSLVALSLSVGFSVVAGSIVGSVVSLMSSDVIDAESPVVPVPAEALVFAVEVLGVESLVDCVPGSALPLLVSSPNAGFAAVQPAIAATTATIHERATRKS
jgi:hypothetical protein